MKARVPRHDHPIELHNLFLQNEQLGAECGKACARNLRHPFVARVGNNMEQFRDSFFGSGPGCGRSRPAIGFGR